MEFLLIVSLWAGLTMILLRRLQVVGMNLAHCVTWTFVAGFIPVPTHVTLRPLKQLGILGAEVFMLMFFYEIFGISILAHVTAAICGVGMMIALREKDAPTFLEGLQLVPMAA